MSMGCSTMKKKTKHKNRPLSSRRTLSPTSTSFKATVSYYPAKRTVSCSFSRPSWKRLCMRRVCWGMWELPLWGANWHSQIRFLPERKDCQIRSFSVPLSW
jgi:hypothetical protein